MADKEKEIINALANYAHKAWSGWMMYLFGKSMLNDDGSVTIPPEAVKRWRRQINSSYNTLPENEKESDRKEARAILDIISHVGQK